MVTHDQRSAERSQRKIDVLDGRVVSDKTVKRGQV
jgi:predicted ABC-type transport system involved in lysophospholipase L1 biosynthesis ATPase subunit